MKVNKSKLRGKLLSLFVLSALFMPSYAFSESCMNLQGDQIKAELNTLEKRAKANRDMWAKSEPQLLSEAKGAHNVSKLSTAVFVTSAATLGLSMSAAVASADYWALGKGLHDTLEVSSGLIGIHAPIGATITQYATLSNDEVAKTLEKLRTDTHVNFEAFRKAHQDLTAQRQMVSSDYSALADGLSLGMKTKRLAAALYIEAAGHRALYDKELEFIASLKNMLNKETAKLSCRPGAFVATNRSKSVAQEVLSTSSDPIHQSQAGSLAGAAR